MNKNQSRNRMNFYLKLSSFQLPFNLRYKISVFGNQSSELLSIHVYMLISRFLFRFKHQNRNFSVLLGRNIDHGLLKE